MKAWQRWMERAELAQAAHEPEEALAALEQARERAENDEERFLSLLARAGTEAGLLRRPEAALQTYEEARLLSREGRLDRAAEAELGAAACLLELGRAAPAREQLQRAAAAFRRRGDALRRGCALLLLAEEAHGRGDEHLAELHAQVAADLLLAAGEPRLLSAALSLHAELASRDGRPEEARELLDRARSLAAEVADDRARHDLRARRREIVRTWVASGARL